MNFFKSHIAPYWERTELQTQLSTTSFGTYLLRYRFWIAVIFAIMMITALVVPVSQFFSGDRQSDIVSYGEEIVTQVPDDIEMTMSADGIRSTNQTQPWSITVEEVKDEEGGVIDFPLATFYPDTLAKSYENEVPSVMNFYTDLVMIEQEGGQGRVVKYKELDPQNEWANSPALTKETINTGVGFGKTRLTDNADKIARYTKGGTIIASIIFAIFGSFFTTLVLLGLYLIPTFFVRLISKAFSAQTRTTSYRYVAILGLVPALLAIIIGFSRTILYTIVGCGVLGYLAYESRNNKENKKKKEEINVVDA